MKHVAPPNKAAGTNQDFLAAFRMVLTHELDRKMLLELAGTQRELRYEELRKAVHEESKQLFQYAAQRLIEGVLVNRRLVDAGERYRTHLSPTPRGMLVFKILHSLGEKGRLPDHLPDHLRAKIQEFFAPSVPA